MAAFLFFGVSRRFVGQCLLQPYNFTEQHLKQVNDECVFVRCASVNTPYLKSKVNLSVIKQLSDFICGSQCVLAFLIEKNLNFVHFLCCLLQWNQLTTKTRKKTVHLMYRSLFVFDKPICSPKHIEKEILPRHICNLSLFFKLLLYAMLLISEQIYEMDVCILLCVRNVNG